VSADVHMRPAWIAHHSGGGTRGDRAGCQCEADRVWMSWVAPERWPHDATRTSAPKLGSSRKQLPLLIKQPGKILNRVGNGLDCFRAVLFAQTSDRRIHGRLFVGPENDGPSVENLAARMLFQVPTRVRRIHCFAL
jgi:hypothetical protein